MSSHGICCRSLAWDLLCRRRIQRTGIEGESGWRDKRTATYGALCGCKSGGFSGGIRIGRVAPLVDYRVASGGWQVAARISGL